jgi:hypothetical protein
VIRRVESNVKAGCQVDLGPKTLIVGPNRSGKSTIVNAIELATTGRASDIAGRTTLALDAELATLMPPGAESVFARAFYTRDDQLPDAVERQVSWSLEKGHKATRAAVPAPAPEVVFPLRDVRENLTKSPETARKWLLGLVAAEVTWDAVLKRIAPALHARVTTLASGTVAGLPVALDTAKRQGRAAVAKAEALREPVATPITHAPPPAAVPDLAALNAAAVRTEAEVSAAQQALDALPRHDAAETEMGERIVSVLKGTIAARVAKCACCGLDGPVDRFPTRLRAVETIIAAGRKVAADRVAAQARVQTALNARSLAWAARSAAQATAAAVTAAVGAVVADVSQEREAEAVAADRDAAAWKELADAIERVMGGLVSESRVAFEESVQRFMPSGMQFGLDLMDGDREVCRFGLRDGALRSALSGAEWAIVTAALAAATTPPDAHAIIVPEERAFDPRTLFETLLAFDSCPSQVIITSPVMPTDVPSGWTVIRCGGEVAASAALPAVTAGVATAPPAPPAAKRGRGRPPMTEEEKARRAAEKASKASTPRNAADPPWA